MGLFAKFKEAWLKPMSFDSLNEGFYDDLEEALILADVGMDTAVDAVAQLKKRAYAKLLTHEEDVKNALRDILAEKLSVGDPALDLSTRPSVALIIGVNGVGKTTSIGKLAHRLKNEGKKVLLCAGDTFRAAAADQLEIWAERAGVDIVRQNEGADPGAVLFDSLAAAKARNTDVVLCDTAGRLHNKDNLMKELAKLRKIIDREAPNAAKETLLVLDAVRCRFQRVLLLQEVRAEDHRPRWRRRLLFPKALIVGHHDLNPVKPCPCFDAVKEYRF